MGGLITAVQDVHMNDFVANQEFSPPPLAPPQRPKMPPKTPHREMTLACVWLLRCQLENSVHFLRRNK